jgi:omega-6 fatty acid desaturase (delta-12 desaturase)
MNGMTAVATESTSADSAEAKLAWKQAIAKYQEPSLPRASWQIMNSFGPYVAAWVLMYFTTAISWWITIPIAVLASGFLVRIFIIFHDCGHGSYFASKRANDVTGFIAGLLTFTPYFQWRWDHAIHHGTSGHLDKRGTGDIWTMTVQEYLDSSRWKRFLYRASRNPFVLFIVAPLFIFVLWQRIPPPNTNARERRSVWWMNLAIVGQLVVMSWIFGIGTYLAIQLTVTLVSGAMGIWLFYVQHQFDGVYWERGDNWNYTDAALQGSSFYKLPKILQWFSGNIGFHHIHHLNPRIPNYNLERCHEADPTFQQVKPLTLTNSLKSLGYRFWDEKAKRLIGNRQMRQIRREYNESQRAG